MGTVFSFDLRGPELPDDVLRGAVARLHDIDARFSTYREDSEISRIARGELPAADASRDVRFVLDECDRWSAETDGWFSARAGGVLDPSGYVKGWAIQQASDRLREAGSTSHSVNGGGDVQCVGPAAASGDPWRVGIADPRDPGRVIQVFSGVGIAVATSGIAERGEHIIDPHTGEPVRSSLLSLTVSGRSVLECDVLATAGFAMGAHAREWFSARPDVRTFAVERDGETWST